MSTSQNVIIVGAAGKVGTELVRQITAYDGPSQGHVHPTKVVATADTGGLKIGDKDEIPCGDGDLAMLARLINDHAELKDAVVIDVTAVKGEAIIAFHKAMLKGGHAMVTANKNPLSLGSYQTFLDLTNDRRRYEYGPTVMAGGESLRWLQQAADLRETVHSIQGCFSGTLGYIASELEKGEKPFSEIVREARQAGYTEPHPWDDLNGLDVARKAVILARSAHIPTEIAQVKLTPFIGEKYGQMTDVEEFLTAIKDEDEAIAKKMSAARDLGNTLRYVAQIIRQKDGIHTVEVGLKEVPLNSELGRLQGTANIVEFISDLRAPKECPHVIKTKGAGLTRTAAVVRAGLLNLLPEYWHLDNSRSA